PGYRSALVASRLRGPWGRRKSEPPPNPVGIPFILNAKNRAQPFLLHRDDDAIYIHNRERQENHGDDLVEDAGLSDIRDRQAQVHWISREPVRAPGYQRGRSLSRNSGGSGAVKHQPAPSRDRCTYHKNCHTRGSQDTKLQQTAKVEYGLQPSAGQVCEDE